VTGQRERLDTGIGVRVGGLGRRYAPGPSRPSRVIEAIAVVFGADQIGDEIVGDVMAPRGDHLLEVGVELIPRRRATCFSPIGIPIGLRPPTGLLHRDAKPANHLSDLDEGEQRILVTDFGIARSVDDISGLTTTNMTVGTVLNGPSSRSLPGVEHRDQPRRRGLPRRRGRLWSWGQLAGQDGQPLPSDE
jgi:hypothetical protein